MADQHTDKILEWAHKYGVQYTSKAQLATIYEWCKGDHPLSALDSCFEVKFFADRTGRWFGSLAALLNGFWVDVDFNLIIPGYASTPRYFVLPHQIRSIEKIFVEKGSEAKLP